MKNLISKVKELVAKIGRRELVNRLGNKNVAKCLRKLDTFLNTMNGDDQFVISLGSLFGIDPKKTLESLKKTREELAMLEEAHEENYDREVFRSHIWVETDEKSNSPIFIKVLVGNRARMIPLESGEVTFEEIKEKIQNHNEKVFRKESPVFVFGKITRYVFRKTFDESYLFDVDGEFIKENDAPVVVIKGSLTYKGRPLPLEGIFGPQKK